MADLRKLQRNMSNALDKNNSCKRNTWFFFRILSSEEKLQLGKNKNKRKKRKCLPISDLKELPTELESECCFGVTHRRQMFVLVNFVLENNIVLTISDELHQSSKMDVYGGCVGRIECSNKPWILPLAWVERTSRILARINGPYGFSLIRARLLHIWFLYIFGFANRRDFRSNKCLFDSWHSFRLNGESQAAEQPCSDCRKKGTNAI